jgi:hypothetical protein
LQSQFLTLPPKHFNSKNQPLPISASSSDIFFDADDEQAANDQQKADSDVPRGRLNALEECLIANASQKVYVPQTQDKGPMTDDMIEQRVQHLTSQSASDRMKEQLDVLLSDMQAFKVDFCGLKIVFWGLKTMLEQILVLLGQWLRVWKYIV